MHAERSLYPNIAIFLFASWFRQSRLTWRRWEWEWWRSLLRKLDRRTERTGMVRWRTTRTRCKGNYKWKSTNIQNFINVSYTYSLIISLKQFLSAGMATSPIPGMKTTFFNVWCARRTNAKKPERQNRRRRMQERRRARDSINTQ